MVTTRNTQKPQETQTSLFKNLLAGLLLLIPIGVFGVVWSQYAVNVPKWDDHGLRFFLNNLDNATSIPDKAYEFFRQHNEHRIVYDRLITWLDYTITGKLNLRHLMLVGNLSLIGLLVIFGLALRQSTTQSGKHQPITHDTSALLYLSPIAFLLFNLSHWENMFWGMAALQNFTVVLWIFAAIYVLSFTNKVWLAVVFAIAATLTSGNGMLVWPVGFAILLVQFLFEKRPYRTELLLWLGSAALLITLYFLGYEKPPGNPPAKGSVVDLLKGWLAFNGSGAEAFPVSTPFTTCLILGAIITALTLLGWLYVFEKGILNKRFSPFAYFFVGATSFLLTSAAIVTWSRVGFGMNGLITSRYKLYSLLLLSLLYSFIITQQPKSSRLPTFGIGLLASIALMACSYGTYLGETIALRQWAITNQFNWTHNANQPTISIDPISKQFTALSPAFYDTMLPIIFGQTQQPDVRLTVDSTATGYAIQNVTLPPQGFLDAGNYLVARSAKRSYLFPVRQNQQPIRSVLRQPKQLFINGFQSNLPTEEMDADTYQLSVLTVSDKNATLHATSHLIKSKGPPNQSFKKNW